MFVINNDMSIYVTRGDICFFTVSAEYDEDTAYKFQPGDILRMKVFEKKGCDRVVLVKNITVEAEAEEVTISLTGSDTKIGGIIHKPAVYWYEIILHPDTNPQTIVGYDADEGPRLFVLLPEGKKITEGELDEGIKSDVQKIIEETAKEYFANTPLSGSIEDEVNKYMKNNPVSNGITPHIGEDRNWWIGLVNTGIKAIGEDGDDGEHGKDGITPLFRINKTTSELEVSYDNGENYESTGFFTIGPEGKPGEAGKNGVTFAPEVDAEGNLSWSNDGGLENPAVVNIRGNDGRDGENGANGEDGYTPVKGKDYFTEADKNEIEEDIKEAVPMILYNAQNFSDEQKQQVRKNIGATGEEIASEVLSAIPNVNNIQILKAGTVVQIMKSLENGKKDTVQITLDAYDRPMFIEEEGNTCYLNWEGFE